MKLKPISGPVNGIRIFEVPQGRLCHGILILGICAVQSKGLYDFIYRLAILNTPKCSQLGQPRFILAPIQHLLYP